MNVLSRKQLVCFLLVALIAAFSSIVCYSNSHDKTYTVEDVVFNTNVVPDTTNDKPLDVKSKLYLPRNRKDPVSAVIISPSSGGVEKERELYYARNLAKSGIAVLIVDSFKSRGLTNSVYDQSVLETWQMVNDAIGGLKFLSKDNRINSKKIGIMGVSKGGSVAMDTAHTIVGRWAGVIGIRFAAHIAISPDCNWTFRSNKTTGAPIYFMLAELDDQTLVSACVNKAKRLSEAGNKFVKTTIYKGAHHAWEELGKEPEYDPNVENFSECRVWVENNGKMRSADTNEIIDDEDWYGWASENCKKLGATCCGGTREQKQKAMQDIITFLRWYDF